MKRRTLVAAMGAGAAWPLVARAQAGVPIIGFLSARSLERVRGAVAGFRQGLADEGMSEGRSFTIDFRWAEGRFERLPELAAALVRQQAAVIVTQATPAALAAKKVTSVIPIVFVAGFDPVANGFVASLNRPGGNATGVTLFLTALAPKRLEILLELAPKAAAIGLLLNPNNPNTPFELSEMQALARARGRILRVASAGTRSDIDAAFASLDAQRVGGVVIGSDPMMADEGERIASLAARFGLPAIHPFREHAEASGLISLGASVLTAYRLAGATAAKILRGAKPGELPVQQPTKVELVVNLKTAKALRLELPEALLARADEVIE
jgi:putative ABC transport system substrate-binding protein